MPVKRKEATRRINPTAIADIVLAQYHQNPTRLRECMPEVANALDRAYPSKQDHASPFGLTANERQRRLLDLESVLASMQDRSASRAEAIKGVEHCAILTEDDSLPLQIDRRTLVRLLGLAIGTPLSRITCATTIRIPGSPSEAVVHRIALVRGTMVNLSHDRRAISISVDPARVKEAPRLMRLTKIGAAGQVTRNGTVGPTKEGNDASA